MVLYFGPGILNSDDLYHRLGSRNHWKLHTLHVFVNAQLYLITKRSLFERGKRVKRAERVEGAEHPKPTHDFSDSKLVDGIVEHIDDAKWGQDHVYNVFTYGRNLAYHKTIHQPFTQ